MVSKQSDHSSIGGFLQRVEESLDSNRAADVEKRHESGYRTARENLEHLVDGYPLRCLSCPDDF
mgnify:CR=1 FL=1